MARVPKKSSTQTAPPMDKLLKPAVGVAIAMLVYYLMKGSEWLGWVCLWLGGWLIMPRFLPPLFPSSPSSPPSSPFPPRDSYIDHRLVGLY